MPFVQAEQSTVRKYGGTGLGLTICQRIARAMGGDLTAQSAGLGMGTTLEFTIPLLTPVDHDAPPGGSRLCEVTEAAAGPLAAPAAEPAVRDSAVRDEAGAVHVGDVVAAPPALSAGTPAAGGTAATAAAAAGPSFVPPPPLLPLLALLPAGPVASSTNILIAEDDALSQMVMRKVLRHLSLRHTLVANGAEAVEAYKRGAWVLLHTLCCTRCFVRLAADTARAVFRHLHFGCWLLPCLLACCWL